MGQLMSVGKQSQNCFPQRMITFNDRKEHHNHMVISGKLLAIMLCMMFLRYFSNRCFIHEK